ncbi:hypothetical protein, partial [Pseudoalteromonas sp. SR43-3]|uniref:hypothetical protein n=1 Tax=Pseudoalteromonas sp. SR43-3 TaxID=2760943 RepID=UPI001C722275
ACLKYLWQTDVSGIAVVTYVGCGDLHKIINCCACHVLGIRQPFGQRLFSINATLSPIYGE